MRGVSILWEDIVISIMYVKLSCPDCRVCARLVVHVCRSKGIYHLDNGLGQSIKHLNYREYHTIQFAATAIMAVIGAENNILYLNGFVDQIFDLLNKNTRFTNNKLIHTR